MSDIERDIRASCVRLGERITALTGERFYFPNELGDSDFEHGVLALLAVIAEHLDAR